MQIWLDLNQVEDNQHCGLGNCQVCAWCHGPTHGLLCLVEWCDHMVTSGAARATRSIWRRIVPCSVLCWDHCRKFLASFCFVVLPACQQDKRAASGALHIISLQQCVDHMGAPAFSDKVHVAPWNNLALMFDKSPFGFRLSIITINEQPDASYRNHGITASVRTRAASAPCDHGQGIVSAVAAHFNNE